MYRYFTISTLRPKPKPKKNHNSAKTFEIVGFFTFFLKTLVDYPHKDNFYLLFPILNGLLSLFKDTLNFVLFFIENNFHQTKKFVFKIISFSHAFIVGSWNETKSNVVQFSDEVQQAWQFFDAFLLFDEACVNLDSDLINLA